MKRTITVQADVQVEVDLRRFSVEMLLEEIKDRDDLVAWRRAEKVQLEIAKRKDDEQAEIDEWVRIPRLSSNDSHPLHGIYYALKFGKKEHAVDLMRDFLCEQFGVVL